MQLARRDLVIDAGVHQLVSLDRGQAFKGIAGDVGEAYARRLTAESVRVSLGKFRRVNLMNKTILQEASGKTMQKLILCATILLLGLTQAQAANDNEVASKSSAYVSLSEPMALNLSGGKRPTLLQISADVLVSDADAESKIKTHVPAIRHSLIMLLSEQKAGDIKSPTKREEIRQRASRA
ncbi:MAG: hypothetical protein GWP56_01820 [Gammaproteobacteria bacterium]|nr:hypothetical protein [Gammaproteobacteria bacterium]